MKKALVLIGAGILTAFMLAATESYALWEGDWALAEHLWPNVLVFLIPALLGVLVVDLANRFFLPGDERSFGRKSAWWGYGLRVATLAIVPVALLLWGYRTNRQLSGWVAVDARNASQTAWAEAQADTPLLSNWHSGEGDNTGGLTVMNIAMYRIFSPDLARPMLLGLLAAIVTTLTVPVTYRLGEVLFSQKIAGIAALVAAVYPEAVMIGSEPQQQGYLALLLGVELLALALILYRPPQMEAPKKPASAIGWTLLGVSLLGFIFMSKHFLVLAVVGGALVAVWFCAPRDKYGRWLWIAAGAAAAVLVALRVLSALDKISPSADILWQYVHYLYGSAWQEFDKLATAGGGGDLFQKIFSTMDRTQAFVVGAFYGLLQPVLPAIIGHRSASTESAEFWGVLGFFRSLGWYMILPVAFYGTVKSLRGIVSRQPQTILALFFWAVTFIASYRSFGDQWDNPRYRLFVLVPMALLAAWAWVEARKSRDPLFIWILVPFVTAVVSLTIWYLLRDYARLSVPIIPSMAVVAALTGLSFLAALFFARRKKITTPG